MDSSSFSCHLCPRDVKPDNILLDEQGECLELWDPERSVGTLSRTWKTMSCPLSTGHAHLTDFNIATIIKDGERATALAGTKPYMGKPKASDDTWPCRAMPLPPSLLHSQIQSHKGIDRKGFYMINLIHAEKSVGVHERHGMEK